MISTNKVVNSLKSLGRERLVPMSGTTNHAAEMLIDNPENAFSHGRNFSFFIKVILTPFKDVPNGGNIK